MKEVWDWIKNSWIGKKLLSVWEMFYNDKRGISMRKALAAYCFYVAGNEAMEHTTDENIHYVLPEIFMAGLALLGLVTYANLKSKPEELSNETK